MRLALQRRMVLHKISSIEQYVKDNDALRDLLAKAGTASFTDAFLGRSILLLAVVAGGFAVQSALRARGEEVSQRAEVMLATPVSRVRWLGAYALVASGGSAIVLVAGGLGIGVSAAAATGDVGYVPRLTADSIAYLPALAILVALVTVCFGAAPRIGVAMWGVLAGCFIIAFFEELLNIPGWVADLSPFQHTPLMPAARLAAAPLAILSTLAALLTLVGLVLFRRRDLAT